LTGALSYGPEGMVLIDLFGSVRSRPAFNSQQLFEKIPNEAEEIGDQIARGCDQVGLAEVAILARL
jgi:hypothetical protein